MVPLPMALSRIFLSAMLALSISPHCARGMAQLLTYEYIGGFSLTSCALASETRKDPMASAHTTTTLLTNCFLMIDPFLKWPGFGGAILCGGSVHECAWHKGIICETVGFQTVQAG